MSGSNSDKIDPDVQDSLLHQDGTAVADLIRSKLVIHDREEIVELAALAASPPTTNNQAHGSSSKQSSSKPVVARGSPIL